MIETIKASRILIRKYLGRMATWKAERYTERIYIKLNNRELDCWMDKYENGSEYWPMFGLII
jgi:hypothetical protein